MHNIHSLVTWFCAQLTSSELLDALTILLEVFDGSRDDIKLKSNFRKKHPNYRLFDVDTTPPSTEAPPPSKPGRDWRELLSVHERQHGKELKPVKRRPGAWAPPANACCEHCGAPCEWLSVNDGKKRSQVRCKICKGLSPIRRNRRQSTTPYRCPYCGGSLYEWKHDNDRTIYKCRSDTCPYYLRRRDALNERERELAGTGMSSQFKVRYQWRRYHFDPAAEQPHAPCGSSRSLRNIRHPLQAVGLVLAYSVSYGLSARMTARILKEIHGYHISRQTVLNWLSAAAPLAWNTLNTLKGRLAETMVAADETYIKVRGIWHYTWFIIGTESRVIWAWEVSDTRGEKPAIAVINRTVDSRQQGLAGTLVLVGDGNGSYDAATNAINTDTEGIPLPIEERLVERRTVVGIRNDPDDEQSRNFRPFKQLIERLNRTYRYHTRSVTGHKSLNGARALTTLFVAHYNFLRPHSSTDNAPPLQLPQLNGIDTLQGRWLKLLSLAA
jgi:transposase-like protein